MTTPRVTKTGPKMMPDQIIAQQGTLDGRGRFTPIGAPLTIDCLISVSNRIVRDLNGQEQTSTTRATLDDAYNLDSRNWRFTLPSRFAPYEDLEAIDVKHVSDDQGQSHEVVFLR